jgi:hypothetical protein
LHADVLIKAPVTPTSLHRNAGQRKDIMRKAIRLLFVALIAALVCSLAAAGAGANRSIEVRGAERGVSISGRLKFIGTEGGAATEMICDVTLRRTLAPMIPKIAGTLMGKLTGLSISRGGTTRSPNCSHGSFIREVHDIVPLGCTHSEAGGGVLTWNCSGAPASLWTLLYQSFQGTLPRITGVNATIHGAQFNLVLLEPFGGTVECLYEGEVWGLISVRETGTVTEARSVRELTALTRIRGSSICPARSTFEGSGVVSPTLTIRLI